jgi:D-alanyl-D-alanine carboxypeptidase/D-alanyl-D-alanine-endopeptidase (penicillin-binding protein 4)
MYRASVVASLLIGASLLAPQPAVAQSFRKPLERVLDADPLRRHLWGIAVADTTGKLLYQRNGDRLFVPASNTKLVATAVAAALLPPHFTVRTSVYGTGPVAEGVMAGHLILYGRGDPTMGERCFDVDTTRAGACATDGLAPLRTLAKALHARGIHTILGDVIGDGSYFEPTIVHPSWETGDLPWSYAVPVSGLGLLDNSLRLTATPNAPGRPADLALSPWLGGLTLENRTRSVAEGQPRTLDVAREADGARYVVSGDIPLTSRVRPDYVAVADPARFAAEAFRRVLGEEGIVVLGGTRATTDSLDFKVFRGGEPLAEVGSRPLKDWIFPILNVSQNWYAEMLLKQLGRQFGQAGSWREGLNVERRFLIDSVGVDSTQFALSDGSGLSSTNLVSPQAFVQLLAFMRKHPRYETWAAGLPRAGELGSLRNRFAGTPVEGRVAAKTGSISRVNTLSGYLRRPDGKTLVFSIQANHHAIGGRAMIAAIDSAVVAMSK